MSEEIIKFKADSRGGFDYSFNNLETLASVKMVINKVTFPIYKEKSAAYIGLKERMDDGDIIEVGLYKKLYRIIKHKAIDAKKGNIYQIKRVDGYSITNFDIDATKVGQRVRVKNRKSFQTMWNDFLIFEKEDE